MNDVAWQLEHSVEADATPTFAWSFWTNVANWDDPPAQFVLDGPFAVGSLGTTLLPGQEPLHWRIRDVQPGKLAAIDMQLDRATLSFEWRFDSVSDRRTRLTQRVVLSGDNAAAYAGQVQAGFGSNLPGGMTKIAAAMAHAEARSRNAGYQQFPHARHDVVRADRDDEAELAKQPANRVQARRARGERR